MRRILLSLLIVTPAMAEDAPLASSTQPPDPNAKIELTLGELQAVVTAQIAQAQAQAAMSAAQSALTKIQAQVSHKP